MDVDQADSLIESFGETAPLREARRSAGICRIFVKNPKLSKNRDLADEII
jgi:hypothetical protein